MREMSRLTARTKNGHAYLVNVKPDEQEVNSPHKNTLQCILDCFERLAAYEDTGLTPEDCTAYAKAESEKRIVVFENYDELNKVRELLQAEREERCVVLPCKVGETVWLTVRGCLEPQKVRTFFVGHPSYADVPFDPRYYMVRLEKYDIPLRDFGKTVFLTREEAEKALREVEHARSE